jgi:thiol-disulfide isomerase/thioredoxin
MSTTEAPVRAPEIDGAVAWINVDRPLSLKALRGKVVLLDFWTYGCVNCMHVLPDLARLEKKYANELVVIGVHSPKFDNEKNIENVRKIVQRYEIKHPVAQDTDFRIWRAYTVRAWPTQVLIDPAGYLVGGASGEGHGEQFDRAIAAVIHVFEERGELDRRPLAAVLSSADATTREHEHESTLKFPGKVLADAESGRLFIADSNHNRILIATTDGLVEREVKGFNRPQGMARIGDTLYVADTEHHAIRAIDLTKGTVRTAAGIGEQARNYSDGGAALETALNSPWDVVAHGPLLFIAMAGPHQIWLLDPTRHLVWPYAGTGQEARLDGPIDESAFAQPSGLTIGDNVLYVADAESNIIRAIDLPPVNQVRTLAGGDLFEFGDKDGIGDTVRLQHPLGVAYHDGAVYIADTYNHRIKKLDPKTGRVETLAGTGKPGLQDGPAREAQFYEPGGISLAGNRLFIADTNNHAIRTIDLHTAEVRTLALQPPRA